MKFEVGARVKIRPLRKNGTVSEVLRPGVYRIALGSLTMTVNEVDLEIISDASPERPAKATAISTSPKAQERIDLHGLTVTEAINRLETALSAAALQNLDRLEIIHGHGTGKIRAAVHKLLGSLKIVKHFKIDDQNQGVTIAYL